MTVDLEKKDGPIGFAVATVSSELTTETDGSGPAVAAALRRGKHNVVESVIIPDNIQAISRFVVECSDNPKVSAVILAGGTGLSKQDVTYEAISRLLDKELPGFGEIFRVLSFKSIGSKAMKSRAIAGTMGSLVIFAIPGSPKAADLAVDSLIAPQVSDIVWELGKEPISVSTDAAPLQPAEEGETVADHVEDEPKAGWQRSLALLDGTIEYGSKPELPDWLQGVAPAREVLESAGQRATIRLPSGEYQAFGFPDLSRPSARVILASTQSTRGEIIALHRMPVPTGIAAYRIGGILPYCGHLSRAAIELTGKEYPGNGRLFAVDSNTIHVIDGGRVVTWDGHSVVQVGGEVSALGSLLLRWSQK